jgi:hypothetical protein
VSDRTLTNGDVEAIADALARKVAEIVGARSTTFGLVDARELAEELGVSTDCVYAHAAELGAMRLGAGPKARIRRKIQEVGQGETRVVPRLEYESEPPVFAAPTPWDPRRVFLESRNRGESASPAKFPQVAS